MTSTVIAVLVLTQQVYDAILHHAIKESPYEACGMVSRLDRTLAIDRFHPMVNTVASATAFAIDGQEMLDLERATDAAGRELCGVMHSHPATGAYPSATDIKDAGRFDPVGTFVHIIVSLAGSDPSVRVFRLEQTTVVEIETSFQ